MVQKLLISLLLITSVYLLHAQDFNYVHYDTRDGLAGSTVYDMCQDKNGFLWFATENGLSRYDGTKFKNFTVQDGLPDNEVLKLFADSKGRIWIGTFNKEVCYYLNGMIHTRQNDDLLKQIRLNNFLGVIVEDKDGVLAFSDCSRYITLLKDEGTTKVTCIEFPWDVYMSLFYACDGKRIAVGDKQFNSYLYENGRFVMSDSYKEVNEKGGPWENHFYSYISCDNRIKHYIRRIQNYIITTYSETNVNRLLFCCTYDGAWGVDTLKNEWGTHFLKGKKISFALIDQENNTWFSTLGDGVYKLPSREIKTLSFPQTNGLQNSEVFSIVKYKGQVIAGLNHSNAAYIKNGQLTAVNYSGKPDSVMRPQTNRLYSIKKLEASDGIILGFDLFLLKIQDGHKMYGNIYPVKSVDEINKDFIVAGTSSYVFKMRVSDLQVTDTIWKERCTKVFYHAGKYYIGTLEGLYAVNEDRTYTYLGKLHPSLTRRITDIKASENGILWIATADEGIVAYRDGKVIAAIRESNGLSGNICKTLFLQEPYLWVATSKGLNKINITDPSYPVVKYTVSDGLPSDIINAVYAEDTVVYVGSPEGLTVFNENKISASSVCRLNMLAITVSGQPYDSVHHRLSYKTNDIRFEYIGVSMKSAGDITYYYRLKGITDEWLQTNQSVIEYPALPAGDYEFNLYAVNKFGVKSDMTTIRFSVNAPFWKTTWFYVLFILLIAAAAGWAVNNRNKKYTEKLKEKNMLQKQFAALEQQALQAQMNPHFIFNCLNGIQQYILTGDKEKANQYLTGFARLIRQTLDNSGKRSVTVTQEMQYLKEYLEMEKMRTGDTFSYMIVNNAKADAGNFEIPAMLLQPYVENAIRHGLRYKKDGPGVVEIIFEKEEQFLVCTIRDNGIGRKQSAALKSNQHIEYQSKGMSLTARRIDLLNRVNEKKMSVSINDLYSTGGQAAGTAVTIKIPVN